MVRYYLDEMDAQGFTENLGRPGRRLTSRGREELESAVAVDRVGFVSARVDDLACSLTFDLEVTVVKEFDVIAVEGAAIMVNTRETESVQKIGSEDLTDFAVDSVEEAVGRQAGVVSRGGELFVRGGRSGLSPWEGGRAREDQPARCAEAGQGSPSGHADGGSPSEPGRGGGERSGAWP